MLRRAFLARMAALMTPAANRAAPPLAAAELLRTAARAKAPTGRTIFVAPFGEDRAIAVRGTFDEPFATLPHAFGEAQPGDTILLRGGVYGFEGETSGWLLAGHGGAPGEPITVANYPGEAPIIDGAAMRPSPAPYQAWAARNTAGGFPLVLWDTSDVILRGVTIRNGPMGGLFVNGTHHRLRVERCVMQENGWLNDEYGTGLGILGRGDDTFVRDCDSFGNRGGGPGATGGNADGISVFLVDSTGTVLAGNRAWRNTDDGFDFFNPSPVEEVRQGSPCLVDRNWSFENGRFLDGSMNLSPDANGDGFKLGGQRAGGRGTHGGHTVTRCLSWGNKLNGFDDNASAGGGQPHLVCNNVSFNDARNVDPACGDLGFAFLFVHHPDTVLRNNVAFATEGRNELRIRRAKHSHNLRNGQAWDAFDPPLELTTADFLSLDDSLARGPRQEDGSLPVSGFLRPAPLSRLIGRGTSAGLPPHLIGRRSALVLGAFEP